MSGIAALQLGGLDHQTSSYWLALALAVVACFVAARLGGGRPGRAWTAVRDDETAATSLGVRPPRVKLLAFATGAAYAGMAGALFAQQYGYVEPAQFDFTLSLMVLSAVVLGARWGVAGAVVGALVVAAYDRVLVDALGGILHAAGAAFDLREQNLVVFGLALYAATLLRRRAPITAEPAAGPARPAPG
jgi:branched-chain amino acid transport system permease protein